MSEILIKKITELEGKHQNEYDGYEFIKKSFLRRGVGEHCVVSVYEIPPHKASYPYHYHHKSEEVFYIISGKGCLRTADGEKEVHSGDLLYFPANEKGAHKLTNITDEPLTYLDFDTTSDIDVTIYPDSNKMGVWGKGINKVYKIDDNKNYYESE